MSPTRTAPDLLSSLTAGWNDAMQKWWDQSQTAIDPWKQAWDTIAPRDADEHRRRHAHDHGHDHGHDHEHDHEHTSCDCDCDSDCKNACRCCIPDADVVLHARAGEQRVIPFLLRNPWRRDREVTVAVGPWQVCDGGRLEVTSVFDVGESLTLQPCEKRVVRLKLLVRGICDNSKDANDSPADDQKRKTGADTKGDVLKDRQLDCDVESCASAYADVRFEGCARPQRVAVVVHPASCDAIVLPCDCGCCC